MNKAIRQMLEPYACETSADYESALREIFQELALLGLWRAKFFEHAAFYGGTALRILYKMDRFSEDLDFSLLAPDALFDFTHYAKSIEKELEAWGFSVRVKRKQKSVENTAVESIFMRANTLEQILIIEAPQRVLGAIQHNTVTRVKIDIDTRPPPGFSTEMHYSLQPFPFSVRTYSLPCLFAGKLSALLYRSWKNRVKGRDWYDYVWFLAKETPVDLAHLQQRMVQSGHWKDGDILSREDLIERLKKKASELDISAAKRDAIPFLKNNDAVALWSKEFFMAMADRIKTI